MKLKKIAVLTSGGDAQGMNACVSIITRVARCRALKVVGVKDGFKGLFENNFVELDEKKVAGIENLGGSVLGTCRFLDFKKKDVLKKCAENIKSANFDAVIVVGGDGSFRGAQALVEEGVRVIAIPATIDNDLRYSDRCLGFDSAVNNASYFVENVKQTMFAMNRGVVFEVMGRNCGDIALHTACSCACDVVAVPERKIDEDEVVEKTMKSVQTSHKPPVVVVAEKMFNVPRLAERLAKMTNLEFKHSIVGYFQRGGSPSVGDRILAMQFGVKAVELCCAGEFGCAIGLSGKNVVSVGIKQALQAEYNFNYELLDLFYKLNKIE